MSDEMPRVLSLLSHELRGPLGVVRGYLRLLDQTATELSDRSRQAIAAALRASDRMADVVGEASLLGHLQIGDVQLDAKPVTLATIVHAAVQNAALPDDCSVLLDPDALPEVTLDADGARLGQALGTLIRAVARPQSGHATVNIRAASTRLNEKAAVGVRIEPRLLDEIEPTESELDMGRGGFGLAIPIAALIVHKHGGRVRELKQGERAAGLVVSLPTAPVPAAP